MSGDPAAAQASQPDNLPNPLADAQAAERKDAVAKLLKGEATTKTINGNRVIEVKSKGKDKNGKPKKSKYVNYPVDREEDIFTILADFGDKTIPGTGGTAGPVHNQIAAARPQRGTATRPTTTRRTGSRTSTAQHYQDMMFGSGESFKDFYLKQSNGRFLAKGDVSDWVKVPYNEARYGSQQVLRQPTATGPSSRTPRNAWYDAQKAAGKSDAEIKAYLAQFDKVDRYDYDGDGNFNEPDGYIDHFQAIHAGEGEEAGGGAQGDGRDLVAPLVRLLQPAPGTSGPDRQPARRHPDRRHRHLDRRLHHRARERRPRRLRARVRPRPRPARPLRHRGRRQRHRLLDADERRLVAQPRHRLDRHHARLHGRRGRSCSSAGSTTRPCPTART